MELKPGYKRTEVGIIPDDWEVAQVGEAFDIRDNLRKPISQTVRERMVGSFPYYGPTGIQGYIEEYRVEGEHALIGEDGDHFLKWRSRPMTQLVSGRFNVNNHAHLIKGTRNLTSWFYHYFRHRDLTPYLTRQGAGRFKLTRSALAGLRCALPHTGTEQEAIAEALSSADAFIESLEQLLVKKRQLKEGVMQEVLTGKRRLPGFKDAWEAGRLGEICEIAMGRTPPRLTAAYWGPGHKWLSIADLKSKIVAESKEEITPSGAAMMQVIRKGTLLMSFKLTIGRLCFAGCDLYTNEAICSFNNPTANADFLYYALGRVDFSRYGKQAVKGYTLNKESLKLVEVLLPSAKEQAAIAALLSEMDADLVALEDKLAKAHALKQGMMQELLTGRIRLV